LTGTGGANNDGVLYMITKTGTFTKPRDLTCATDGCNNWVPLGQRTEGTLYGVSSQGGGAGGGTIYTLSSASYPRFIVVQNYPAASPRTIDILGNGFTGATAVKFGSRHQLQSHERRLHYGSRSSHCHHWTRLGHHENGPRRHSEKAESAADGDQLQPDRRLSRNSVTITGTGFTGATAVTFGEVKATSFTVTSATQINTTNRCPVGRHRRHHRWRHGEQGYIHGQLRSGEGRKARPSNE
jgi:hypothetical protein